jgi:hypothetical protein
MYYILILAICIAILLVLWNVSREHLVTELGSPSLFYGKDTEKDYEPESTPFYYSTALENPGALHTTE